jgi:NitT/TauT family transport system permease protein
MDGPAGAVLSTGAPARRSAGADTGERLARRQRRQQRCWRAARVGLPLLTGALIWVLWEWWAARADSIMIPGAAKTFAAVGEQIGAGEFWSAVNETGFAVVVGFVICAVVGIPLGIAMASNRTFERVADVYVSMLLVTPMAAMIPLLIMATGITSTTRVIVVVTFAVPMVVVNTRAGVKGVDASWTEMATCFGARRSNVWRRVVIPGSAIGIATGLRLALARAITGALLVELLLVPVGIGGLLLDYRGSFQADRLYATVLLIIALSLLMLRLLRFGERLLLPWGASAATTPAD